MEGHLIEAIGMRLANRAYLYRIFHIIFGAAPSSDEYKVLSEQMTIDAFLSLGDAKTEKLELACDKTATDTLSSTAELLAALGEKIDDKESVASLRADFTRLFLVPGDSYVYPWESPYVDKNTMLFQESTLDVRSRYSEYGFAAIEFGHFPDDHLSMMLDFLAHISSHVFDAFGNGDDETVLQVLSSQGDFLATHLTNWLPCFYEELCQKDKTGIYCQFTKALLTFLEIDKRFIANFIGGL